ncbi:hypothetical protein PF002_g7505 [Phytophthora fragariae]|uniref:Uncharacterized protein n=1 Tax=Phytophthora fragariae TaxID=53985 RepID=A0A6A4A044_9STRA|nr:hypothetical protein PF011_g1331 [Phytophthora fragariae]KAE9136915.1 hypothetical protein PF007_g1989 [Phytophthora fragariae]KAE9244943.1 hypothetical protein PF002_g7505 [Phytophthora fragariae]
MRRHGVSQLVYANPKVTLYLCRFTCRLIKNTICELNGLEGQHPIDFAGQAAAPAPSRPPWATASDADAETDARGGARPSGARGRDHQRPALQGRLALRRGQPREAAPHGHHLHVGEGLPAGGSSRDKEMGEIKYSLRSLLKFVVITPVLTGSGSRLTEEKKQLEEKAVEEAADARGAIVVCFAVQWLRLSLSLNSITPFLDDNHIRWAETVEYMDAFPYDP